MIAPLQMPLDWDNLDWDKMNLKTLREQIKFLELVDFKNISEYYDDTSFFLF